MQNVLHRHIHICLLSCSFLFSTSTLFFSIYTKKYCLIRAHCGEESCQPRVLTRLTRQPQAQAGCRRGADRVLEGARGLAGGLANTLSPVGPTLQVTCRQPRRVWRPRPGLLAFTRTLVVPQLHSWALEKDIHTHAHTHARTHTHTKTVPTTQAGSPGPHRPPALQEKGTCLSPIFVL